MKTHLFTFLVLLTVSSCVGTIQDTVKKKTEANLQKAAVIQFAGINKAVAVAHNRVQIYFKPASGGSGEFSYLIFQDGNLTLPVASVSQSELSIDKNGNYSVLVSSGLVIGTRYTFLARSYDQKNNVQDSNNVQVSVQTLNYKTPIFDGIQTVQNISGVEGETALTIGWNAASPATTNGGVLSGNTDTISGYNIYVGDKEENMTFYAAVSNPAATSTKLSGLVSGQLYYISVRAKDSESPPVEDLNEKFIAKKTLTRLPISFDGVSSLSIPNSSAGFSNIVVNWAIGSGNYDRYKIYASNVPVSSFNPQISTNLIETITDLSVTTKTINVPDANTNWYISVVACNDSVCTDSKGQSVVKYIKTTPPIAAFNGIKTISQPAGGDGLSSLDLTWDLPDSNSGVYDEIRIFKSNAAGNFNSFTDRIDDISYNISTPSVTGVALSTSTSVRVYGLPTGVESCFVAQAYSTTPFDAANPFGRTALTRVVKCATPQYIVPGFAGVKSTCQNRTADSFKISWNAPNPTGTFEEYEVYYKEGSSGFDIAAALSGNSDYTKKSVLSSTLSYTLSNLKLDTAYQVLVKTHFKNIVNNVDYRDNNSILLSCTTTGLTVAQGPWFELFAIGPKFNSIKQSFIAEKLSPLSGDAIRPEWRHQFPYEDNTGTANGIIRIAWEDMVLSNGQKLKNYYATPNTGYKVYRMAYNSIYGSAGPSYNDPSWGSPINSSYIQAPSADQLLYNRSNSGYVVKTIAQFIDETLVHPYNDNISKANQATVYWYKIEAWYNGKKLPFTTVSSDAVVRMVLPPKNMSFIHRWMSNKQICEEMNQSFDRSNNYKCLYTGMGAVLDTNDSQYYYDMKGDLLVDRFRMGCNFSRGNVCSIAPMKTMPGFEGSVANASRGVQQGDCISGNDSVDQNSEPQDKILAPRGAVFYNRFAGRCYVNTSSTATGTTWSAIQDLDEDHNVGVSNMMYSRYNQYHDTNVAGSYYHIADSFRGPAVTRIPPYSSKYPSGLNFGAAYSSDSNLPPINKFADHISLYYMCQSSQVKVNNLNIEKRLARRKETIVYKAESPLLSATDRTKLETGNAEALAYPGNVNFVDRDCDPNSTYSNYVNNSVITPKYYTISLTNVDYNNNWYANTYNNSTPGDWYKVVDTLVTGSAINATNKKSTEACVSRFGVQDYMGGIVESTTDMFYCNQNTPPYGCFTGHKDYAKSAVFTPPIDPDNRENYKNANGQYYSNLVSSAPLSDYSVGTRLLPQYNYSPGYRASFLTDYFCTISGGESSSCGGLTLLESAKFYNLAMGFPMACEGDTCLLNASDDSNALVTTRATAPSPATIITAFDPQNAFHTNPINRMLFIGFNPGSVNVIFGLYSGNENGDAFNRYNSVYGYDRLYNKNSGRCVVLLPENY